MTKKMDEIYLTQEEFDALLEYSTSIPTGTATGKQWRRHVYTFEIKGMPYHAGYVPRGIEDYADFWMMGEYLEPVDMRVPIRWKRIVLKDNPLLDQQEIADKRFR